MRTPLYEDNGISLGQNRNSNSNKSTKPKMTVLHVEVDPFTRVIVKDVIGQFSDTFTHLGVAESGERAVSLCQTFSPSIVIFGSILSDMDEFSFLMALSQMTSPLIVFLFTSIDSEAAHYYIRNGLVKAVIWKSNNAQTELKEALAAISEGHTYFPHLIRESIQRVRLRPNSFYKLLSDRELFIMPLFGEGLSDSAIAARLGVSMSTVHSHRHRIMHKLQLNSSIDLFKWAMDKGFARARMPLAQITS